MMLLEFASEAHVRERAYALPASICCLIPYVVILYVPRLFPSHSGESSPYVYSTGLITIKGWLNFTIHGPFFGERRPGAEALQPREGVPEAPAAHSREGRGHAEGRRVSNDDARNATDVGVKPR